MDKPGFVVENPVTGERAVFPRLTGQSAGDVLQFDLFVKPGGFVVDEHIHPHQAEHFIVRAGTICLRIGGNERNYTIGEDARVPAGTPHVWWNAGVDEVHAVVQFTGKAAHRFIPAITSFFALAQAGKTDKKGNPSLLQSAVILYEYRDVLCAAPMFVQNIIVPPVALLGRLLGTDPTTPTLSQTERSGDGLQFSEIGGISSVPRS